MSSDFPPVPPGQFAPGPAPQQPPAPKSGISVVLIVLIVFGVAGAVVLGIGVLTAMLLPAVQMGREAARRSLCMNNAKQIAMALQSYHDVYRSYPPAYFADETGRPTHSWRVMILPFLGDPQAEAAYRLYRFDEPWDGPNNRLLAETMPQIYGCPSDGAPAGETSYLAVVDDETMWPGERSVNLSRIVGGDGAARTISLVESAGSGINWLEPRDLDLQEATQGVNVDSIYPGIRSAHTDGAIVMMADTSIHFLGNDTPPEDIRAMLTIDGGEKVEPPDW